MTGRADFAFTKVLVPTLSMSLLILCSVSAFAVSMYILLKAKRRRNNRLTTELTETPVIYEEIDNNDLNIIHVTLSKTQSELDVPTKQTHNIMALEGNVAYSISVHEN